MERPSEESDQRPEEAPPEHVVEDDESGTTRDEARESPGRPGEEGQATGHPPNAG